MSWENHAKYGWHIDHATPIAFQHPTLAQKIERLHYTNTQPAWAVDNLKRGNLVRCAVREPIPQLDLTEEDVDTLFAELLG